MDQMSECKIVKYSSEDEANNGIKEFLEEGWNVLTVSIASFSTVYVTYYYCSDGDEE